MGKNDKRVTKRKHVETDEQPEEEKQVDKGKEAQATPCKHLLLDSDLEELRKALNKKRRVDTLTEEERDASLEKYLLRFPIPEAVGPIPETPYPVFNCMPHEWSVIDVQDATQLQELETFLGNNYVQDDEYNLFQLQYSAHFLRWALATPGYRKDWQLAIRDKVTNEIVGFVAGRPTKLRIRQQTLPFRVMNFLCVHKNFRGHQLAPLLISEVARRAALEGYLKCIYPSLESLECRLPLTRCRLYHRRLKIKKLVRVGFCDVPEGSTLKEMVDAEEGTDELTLEAQGLREMQPQDVPKVTALYTEYMARFGMALSFTEEEVEHHLLCTKYNANLSENDRFLWTYVVEDPETHDLTDFFSFFSVPMSVRAEGQKTVKTVKQAFLYYYATDVALYENTADDKELLKDRLMDLIGDALTLAQQKGFDVFNAWTMMDNMEFMEDLKFVPGRHRLRYLLAQHNARRLTGELPLADGMPVGKGVGLVIP